MNRLENFRKQSKIASMASLRNMGGIIIFLANALSSYLFFVEYGSLAFERFGQASALIAGLWGFIVVDVAYAFWHRLQMHDAEMPAQVSTAKTMFVTLFGVSVAISALYFGMSTSQVLFVLDENTSWYLNLFALIFLTAPVVVNIVGYHYYHTSSKEAVQIKKLADVRQLQANTELAEYEIRAEQSIADREQALREYREPMRQIEDKQYRQLLDSQIHVIPPPPNAPRQTRTVASNQPSVFGTGGGGDDEGQRPNS